MKVCPNCGNTGDSMFCPNCGTKMVDQEEVILNEQSEAAVTVNDAEQKEVEISIASDERTDLVQGSSESVESDDASNSSNAFTEAETEFDTNEEETITDESVVVVTEPSEVDQSEEAPFSLPPLPDAEDKKIQEKKPQKSSKALKILGIGVGAFFLLIVAISLIGNLTKDSIKKDMQSTATASINSLTYNYPDKWEKDENKPELYGCKDAVKYTRWNKNGNFMGRMFIYYVGDDKNFNAKDTFSYLTNNVGSKTLTVDGTDVKINEYDTQITFTDSEESYATKMYTAVFEKDYSQFYVEIEVLDTEYSSEVCDEIIQGFEIGEYKNPRTAKSITASYTGSNTPGTAISSGNNNVTVTVEYDNGDTEQAEKWSMDEVITIEEGKTSEATVSCHGLNCKLEVTGRKPVEISAKYNGSTKAGTKVSTDDITVTVKFDTGESEEVTDFTLAKKVKLKAGETSIATVKYGDLSYDISIECTTLSKEQYKAKCVTRNYKDQLRKASYDKYIKIYGQVLQDCGYGYYRISSNGGYDDVYMVYAPDSDIVEDDWCTVYGVTAGIYEYETVMGARQKVPQIDAKYVDR